MSSLPSVRSSSGLCACGMRWIVLAVAAGIAVMLLPRPASSADAQAPNTIMKPGTKPPAKLPGNIGPQHPPTYTDPGPVGETGNGQVNVIDGSQGQPVGGSGARLGRPDGLNPNNAKQVNEFTKFHDADHDGYNDWTEKCYGTDPNSASDMPNELRDVANMKAAQIESIPLPERAVLGDRANPVTQGNAAVDAGNVGSVAAGEAAGNAITAAGAVNTGGAGITQGVPDTPPPPTPRPTPRVAPKPAGIDPAAAGLIVGGVVVGGVALAAAASAGGGGGMGGTSYHCSAGSSWCYKVNVCCRTY